MRKILFVAAALVLSLLPACWWSAAAPKNDGPVTMRIVAEKKEIGQDSVPVYMLRATTGEWIEVDSGSWRQAKVGAEFPSAQWERVAQGVKARATVLTPETIRRDAEANKKQIREDQKKVNETLGDREKD